PTVSRIFALAAIPPRGGSTAGRCRVSSAAMPRSTPAGQTSPESDLRDRDIHPISLLQRDGQNRHCLTSNSRALTARRSRIDFALTAPCLCPFERLPPSRLPVRFLWPAEERPRRSHRPRPRQWEIHSPSAETPRPGSLS